MRLGLIGRCDRTGLGVQTLEFAKHMHPDLTLLLDLSEANNHRFALDPLMLGQYPGEVVRCTPRTWPGGPWGLDAPDADDRALIEQFLDRIDVLYTAETPYWYWLFDEARKRGVRTVLHYNYEFCDYVNNRELPRPDVFIAPSLWHVQDMPTEFAVEYLPFPIPDFPMERRRPRGTRPLRFLHVAGNHTEEDRNGTRIMAEAISMVRSGDVRFLITSRYRTAGLFEGDPRIYHRYDLPEYWMPYVPADILVMPRRFGGLCLPLNEALSAGLPVLMTDCSPQNLFLPNEMLLPASHAGDLQTRSPVELYDCDPYQLALRIDALINDTTLLDSLQHMVPMLAERWTWQALKPEFDRVLGTQQ